MNRNSDFKKLKRIVSSGIFPLRIITTRIAVKISPRHQMSPSLAQMAHCVVGGLRNIKKKPKMLPGNPTFVFWVFLGLLGFYPTLYPKLKKSLGLTPEWFVFITREMIDGS